nr:phage tail assembly chaperone [uncultured Sphingomonas sp.]
MFGERAVLLAGLSARVLGWRPGEFWDATPAEMAVAVGGGEVVEPVAGDELAALLMRFPDEG